MRCVEPTPKQRYQSMAELAAALRQVPAAAMDSVAMRAPRAVARKSTFLYAGAALVVSALVGFVAWRTTGRDGARPTEEARATGTGPAVIQPVSPSATDF